MCIDKLIGSLPQECVSQSLHEQRKVHKQRETELPDVKTDFESYRREFVARLRGRKGQDDYQSKSKQFEYVTKKQDKASLLSHTIKKRKVLILED